MPDVTADQAIATIGARCAASFGCRAALAGEGGSIQ